LAEVVDGGLLTAEARIQSRIILWLFCCRNLALPEGFQRVYLVITPALHSHSSIHVQPRCIIPANDSVFKQHTKWLK